MAGLRALLQKGTILQDLVASEAPDVLCIQETKLSDWSDCPKLGKLDGYEFTDSISVAKKGYAGVRTYVRKELPHAHSFGFKVASQQHDDEGRVITTMLSNLGVQVVNSYVPNAGMTLDRLDFRVGEFDPMVRKFLNEAQKIAPVVWTGDLNVAERDYEPILHGIIQTNAEGFRVYAGRASVLPQNSQRDEYV